MSRPWKERLPLALICFGMSVHVTWGPGPGGAGTACGEAQRDDLGQNAGTG
jgi:hypothetical protein